MIQQASSFSAKKQDSFIGSGVGEESHKSSGITQDSETGHDSRAINGNAPPSDILEIIEKNEKMNEVGPEKLIEHGN